MKKEPPLLLRALAGENLARPPIWLMRQAGRYLPEYLATRAQAGSFLELCYASELAAEVTLQPIRRFGFDAAILFADILLLPHGLGRNLWFEAGEGPRLEPLTSSADVAALAEDDALHARLAPVYDTVRRLKAALPTDVALIGFAGAPWTVATYVVAGRGKDDQAGALRLMREAPTVFEALMARLESATVAYLSAQIAAGADCVKLFDSWAGALSDDAEAFERWCVEPTARIRAALRRLHPHAPLIGFPRGAATLYPRYAEATGVDGVAFDETMDAVWVRDRLQPLATVQGGLNPALLVSGGRALEDEARRYVETLGPSRYIFNLGHGITPEANPRHVETLVRIVKG